MVNRIILTLYLLLLLPFTSEAQWWYEKTQYFDGADTGNVELKILIDTTRPNSWQIGRPQKQIFDSAATYPNVIVTDTINFYPVNDTSQFVVGRGGMFMTHDIFAFRWLQKLDLDSLDAAIVEFSADSGITWHNAFTDPLAYNFYGF